VGKLQSEVDAAKRDKEAAELKLMTQSIQLSCVDNSKTELDSALARKNAELDACQLKSDSLQTSVQQLEAKLNELHVTSQRELDNCRPVCTNLVNYFVINYFQCFDAFGWAAGRASGL